MKRTKNFIIALIAVVAMAFSALTLASCEEKGSKESAVNGTYTMELSAEQCAGNLYASGFMDSLQASETNTLVLTDGNYTLTKHVKTPETITSTDPTTGESTTITPGIDIKCVFTGTYTLDGEVIVLSKAADCEFDAKYGIYVTLGLGFTDSKGKASDGDMFKGYGTWEDDPLDMFPGEFIAHANGFNEEVRVEVDSTNKSYKLVKAASSDDD